ncbi:MAG TPA: ABC transporter substrate-binding protein [Peptococcaceae bacterium]|nr:ABC transporter substrate-binding protein [Peptococcaceae bacterium]
MKKSVFRLAVLLLVIVVGVVGVSGCGTSDNSNEGEPTIIVSSKPPTEAMLLGTMTYMYLEHLDYPVENHMALGSLSVIRPALESGEINCYWEYTGTVLINIMDHEPSFDAEECYQLVKEYDAKNGIVWLDYSPFNNTYGIMVRKDIADKYNLKTISDLVDVVNEGAPLKFASSQEWQERSDGMKHWEKVYGFTYPEELVANIAVNMTYEALDAEQAEVGLAFTTDPRILGYGLVLLEDDKNAFPVYNPAPLFRQEIIDAYPEIPEQMKKLSEILDEDTIMALSKAVDIDKKSVDEVARNFLQEQGLID